MTASVGNSRSREPSPLAEEARELLLRYPALSGQELQRLIDIFPQLPILDVGLMTSDDRLAPKLDAFQREHGRAIKTALISLLIPLSYPIIMTLVVLWAIYRL